MKKSEKPQFFNIKKKTEAKKTNPDLVVDVVQKRMIYFLVLIVISLFIVSIKVFSVQIINNESYKLKLDAYVRRHEMITTPRGEVYDRNGKLILANEISQSIIYYPPLNQSLDDKWELALDFVDKFTIDEPLNTSDLQDLFMFLYKDEVDTRLSEEEKLSHINKEISESEFHNLKKSKIVESDFKLLTDKEQRAYKVYQKMTQATAGGMKLISKDVDKKEITYLAEHSHLYPGFQSFSDWNRKYLDDFGLRSIIGSVSTEKQGLPLEQLNYFLAKGYTRNERVGRSGLELYYEDIISGDKTLQDIKYNDQGYAYQVEVREGVKGDDLYLTVDLDLQKHSEEVVLKYLKQEENNRYRKYFDSAYVIVTDVKTGEILSSVAIKNYQDGKYINDPSANHLDAIEPGSTIKGAMVYMGLAENLVSPYEQILDTPIKIAFTPAKSSYQNLVSTNAISALAQSSNVYMFHVAMRSAKAVYQYDKPLYGVDHLDFQKMKANFSSFGLGNKTGIDMPIESEGYIGQNFQGGLLLDYAIGQFDTYTPMQLATYINTIANDGVRVSPRYLKYAKNSLTDVVVYDKKTEILSTLEDLDALSYVQQGFRACVTEGLCRAHLNHDRYNVAAKTGTSENTFRNADGEVILDAPHSLLTAYAPYESPEVAITCVAPNSSNTVLQANICQPIANDILDFYFNNK